MINIRPRQGNRSLEVNDPELVELQVQLARWQYKWHAIWNDPVRRREVAEQSGHWPDRVLEISGLME